MNFDEDNIRAPDSYYRDRLIQPDYNENIDEDFTESIRSFY